MCNYHNVLTEKYNFNETEKRWVDFLEQSNENMIEEMAETTEDRWFFEHFSPLRTAILQWYPFKSDSIVMEIGAGYGEITGYLCEKCKRVVAIEKYEKKAYLISQRYKERSNLDIYADNIDNLHLNEKFDYIILNGSFGYQCNGSGVMQDYINYLNKIRTYLKKDGKVLFTIDNSLGVQYLSGKPAPSSGLPFDTLTNCSERLGARCFSRKELFDIVQESDLKKCKIYYPLPDWKYAQEIYTDEYLPTEKWAERIVSQYTYNDCAVADERIILDAFVRNDSFKIVTNSFLIEASDYEVSDVIYATSTLDRGRENSFSTIMYDGGEVEKKAIYDAGLTNLEVVETNHKALRMRGIPIIESKRVESSIIMPRIKCPTLSDFLYKKENLNEKKIYDLFDKLVKYIKCASDNEEGVVYVDMVPFNCFVMPDGEFLFFDQEFVRNDCNWEYVMFRALMYTYFFAPFLEEFISLERMKQRYGLVERWDCYEKMEREFVEANRRYDKNKTYWLASYADYQKILSNKQSLRENSKRDLGEQNANLDEKKYDLGYIAGVFDLFHIGHLNLVRNAKNMCKRLMVGVLTDELVEHFKGKRPCIPQNERMEILAGTKYVDEVVSVGFENIDKIDAWNLYHFDCLFSGDDWKDSPKWIEDKEKLQSLGSDIHFFGYTQGQSSTQIKEKMKG